MNLLDSQKITWVEPGQSVPLSQGMALNKLNEMFPVKSPARQGWFLYTPTMDGGSYGLPNQPIDLEQACYYLIERTINLEGSDKPVKCLVAFQELGYGLQGAAIFK